MPVQVINSSGTQYGMVVNPDGSINTVVSGITIDIGSAIIQLEDVYVRSGTMFIVSGNAWTGTGSVYVSNAVGSESYIKGGSIQTYNPIGIGSSLITNFPSPGSQYITETNPAATNKFNYKTVLVYSGTAIGSIYREHSTGSWVQVLTYNGANISNISAWSAA